MISLYQMATILEYGEKITLYSEDNFICVTTPKAIINDYCLFGKVKCIAVLKIERGLENNLILTVKLKG